MPRLTSVTSGVVVSVSDETAALLGAEWVPVDGTHATAVRSELPDSTWTNKELKAYAAEHQIDLGEAKNKTEFLAAIGAGTESGENGSDDSGSSGDE